MLIKALKHFTSKMVYNGSLTYCLQLEHVFIQMLNKFEQNLETLEKYNVVTVGRGVTCNKGLHLDSNQVWIKVHFKNLFIFMRGKTFPPQPNIVFWICNSSIFMHKLKMWGKTSGWHVYTSQRWGQFIHSVSTWDVVIRPCPRGSVKPMDV